MQNTPSTADLSEKTTATLIDLVSAKISSDPSLSPTVAEKVLAAFADSGTTGPDSGGVLAGMFLRSITVQGFRGIGPKTTLPLQPSPGLTLVVGRNGCGKSSFAEAAEFAITGDNMRWSGRQKIWREGWRNLHDGATPNIEVELQTEAAENPLTIAGTWGSATDLDNGVWTARRKSDAPVPLDRSQLSGPLESFRPFLSYSELGSLIDGSPTAMYDALHRLLGLNDLTSALERLTRRRLDLDKAAKAVKNEKDELALALSTVDDERAKSVAALLVYRTIDLDAVVQLASGTKGDMPGMAAALTNVIALSLPTDTAVESAANELDSATARRVDAATSEAESDTAILQILDLASSIAESGDCPCPVCGQGQLDEHWRERTAHTITNIRRRTAELTTAKREYDAAVSTARALIHTVPQALSNCPIDSGEAVDAWRSWADLRTSDPAQLPTQLRDRYAKLREASADLQQRAQAELSRLDTIWSPLATRIAAWVEGAKASADAADELKIVKAAETWLKQAAAGLRTERMQPLADVSQRVWTMLRQQSNVELGGVVLTGNAQQRRVSLDVTVDGVPGAALGVMSQGELHSLGLSLFLPRATTAQSPFRFLMIDDPVQSMDPAKVDGLAKVLADVSRTWQVIVFTHDLRLTEAVRHLQIPATILEVQRRERSVVEVRVSIDPVRRSLADARALQLTTNLPNDEANELIALCCRQAIESASTARVHKILGEEGFSQIAIAEQLIAAERTKEKLALAVLLDRTRVADALAELDREVGHWASAAVGLCNRGAHGSTRDDLGKLIKHTERIAAWLGR
ncbi:ATP-binding protein [Nocardia vaccinii]|uniref:ATP-binding protein n=1 Tax=Nocardia vaccinii TaxID=1822 RepID=UPI000A05D9A9|nr:AAA family ATPase [Nocardia vaccinii]